MSWLEKILEYWRNFAAKMDAREDAFRKKYLDATTYSGAFRALFFWFTTWYLWWHLHEIYAWVFGEFDPPLKPREIAWYRLWANIICGGGVAATVLSIIMMTFRRFRARNEQPDAAPEDKPADGDEA